MLLACLLTGLVGLSVPAARSSSIYASFPHWEVSVWYAGLVLGSVISLSGTVLKGIDSLITERVGLSILVCLTLAYSLAVVAQVGYRGILTAAFTGLFAIACVSRVVQITSDLKRTEERARGTGGE
jgi:hypothetical protein